MKMKISTIEFQISNKFKYKLKTCYKDYIKNTQPKPLPLMISEEAKYLKNLQDICHKINLLTLNKNLAQEGLEYLENLYKHTLSLESESYKHKLFIEYLKMLLECVLLGLGSEALNVSKDVVNWELNIEEKCFEEGKYYVPNYQNHTIIQSIRATRGWDTTMGESSAMLVDSLEHFESTLTPKKAKPEFKSWQQPWKYHK